MSAHLLSLIILIPIIGSISLLLFKERQTQSIKNVALAFAILQMIFAVWLVVVFDVNFGTQMTDAFQFIEKVNWISMDVGTLGTFNIAYLVGVDGISVWLVFLTSFIMLIGIIASWKLKQQVHSYFMLYLLLSGSIVGCFVALDFFLFYLFFELMLLPMFFLIGLWGGPRKSYASIKFFIYTLIGSLLILIVMIGLYLSVKSPDFPEGQIVHTFNLIHMMNPDNFIPGSALAMDTSWTLFGMPMRWIAFLALLLGFAIKLPVVPFHTWLPDAHVEASTPISVVLAALLLKVGGYGLYRVAFSIFPEAAVHFGTMIAILGVISILYGGLNAMAQQDLKRLIAYSSVAHMGFVLVGLGSLTVEGASGGVFQMISHGLISAASFLIVGVIYDRTQDRTIENFSGLATKLPGYTFVVVLVFFASLGLPGLSGFVGELMVLMGAFQANGGQLILPLWIGGAVIVGILIASAYYLWVIQRMFFGKYWVREERWLVAMKDLDLREWLLFTPLIVGIVVLGLYPKVVLDAMGHTMQLFITHVAYYGQLASQP